MTAEDDLARLEHLLNSRWSCRAFLPDAVPQPLLDRVLAIAQRTASWCNSQPWQLVITGPETTEKFREALYTHAQSGAQGTTDFPFPAEYRGIYLERRRDAGFKLYDAVGIGRKDMEGRQRQSLENFRFFGAPYVAIITSDAALGPYGAVDCGGYVANFLLAAQAAGIAAVPQAAIAHYSDFVREYLEIPEDRRIVCAISFGYADPGHPANSVHTTRAAVSDAVSYKK
jgi:nitroreductase